MRLTVDLDSLELIADLTDRRRVSRIETKRGAAAPLEITFVRSGVAELLAASSVITLSVKEDGKYDADPVVLHQAFSTPATADDPYEGSPSFNTAELNALFNIDGDPSNDVASVDLMAELSWAVGAAEPTKSRTFTVRVHNNVYTGSDGEPTPVPRSADWLAANGMRVDSVDGAWTYDPANGVLQAVSFQNGSFILNLGESVGDQQVLLVSVPEASVGAYRAQVTTGTTVDAAAKAATSEDIGGGSAVTLAWSTAGTAGNGWMIELEETGAAAVVTYDMAARTAHVAHDGHTWAEVVAALAAEGINLDLQVTGSATEDDAVGVDLTFHLAGGYAATEVTIEGAAYFTFPTKGLYALAFDNAEGERDWKVARIAPAMGEDVVENPATSITLDAANSGRDRVLAITASGAVTLQVAHGVRVGTVWQIVQSGTGQGTVTGAPGVVVLGTKHKTPERWQAIRVRVLGNDYFGRREVLVEGGAL